MKKMTKKPMLEFLLKGLNFLLALSSVSMLVLGLFYLIKWKSGSHDSYSEFSELDVYPIDQRQLLRSIWFIYLLLAIGTTLFLISCFGYIGTRIRSSCCLSSYSVLLCVLVISELVAVAILLCRRNLNQGFVHVKENASLYPIYHLIQENWKVVEWIVLVALVLEVVALVLAIYLSTKNPAVYDSSDDGINANSAAEQGILNNDKDKN